MNHVRLLKILKEILLRIEKTAIGDDDAFMEASYKRVRGLEDNDSEEVLFSRRMGMRDYLRMLRISRVKIRDSVENKRKAAEAKAKAKEGAENMDNSDAASKSTQDKSVKS